MNDDKIVGVEKKITQIVKKILKYQGELEENFILYEVGLDSLKIIELVLEIENCFGFEFDTDKLSYPNMKSIYDISHIVKEMLRGEDV